MRRVLYFLKELEARDVDWFIANGVKNTLPKGMILINENQYVSALYLVTKGALIVSVPSQHDTEIAILKEGELVGELSFLDSRPPNATVTAALDTTVLAIPRWKLEAKLEEDPHFASRFYRALGVLLANRLRKTVSHLGFPHPDSLKGVNLHDQKALDSAALAEDWLDFILRKFNEP
ncbi:MAG: cyclic nucleotide-binding domain-containing protein [Acidobacteriota bacterium]|nr:cyclic nucleotide-binding domain-containing protein [Acidobacteriota bacterium]